MPSQHKNNRNIAGLTSLFVLLQFLVIGLILSTINVNAQNGLPLDLRDNLKLIKAIDFTNGVIHQTTFTDRNEPFVISRNRRTKEWTLQKGDVSHLFSPCGNGNYTGGTLDREGNQFATGCDDFSVELWDTATGNIASRFNVSRVAKATDYLIPHISPDGKHVVVEVGERAELWDIPSNKKIANLTSELTNCYCNRSIYSVEFSADSKVVAIAYGGMVFLWNTQNGQLLNRLIDKKPDFAGYDEKDQITVVGTVRNMLFTKSGKMIIIGSGIGITSVWDVETGELLRKFKKHKLEVTALALSPDQKILATGSRNQDVKLWDFVTGKQLMSLNTRKEVSSLAFDPDGKKLLSMTATYAFIWDTTTGRRIEEMPTSGPLTTKFSRNWRYFIKQDEKIKSLKLYQYIG